MPRLKHRVPSYCQHKASGQAVVTLNGKDHYLGPYDSPESRDRYNVLIGEWLSAGRQAPPDDSESDQPLTISEIFLPYWEFARQHYRKRGRPTSELHLIGLALRPLIRMYGRQPAKDFGPLSLKAYRDHLIESNLSRKVINQHVGRVKRFFKWATENELVPPSVYRGLMAVAGLQRGRSNARETDPVKPVPDQVVDAVLPHVSRQVAAMIQTQRFTGMRPCEVMTMRGCDLDTSGKVWTYHPESHKTEHHGIERVIYIGPQAQEVIKPFLKTDLRAYLFSPSDAETERNAKRRITRKTPTTPSQRARGRKRRPKKVPGKRYNTNSYRHAIHGGCDKAFSPPEPLRRQEGETVAQWTKRLTEKQKAELARWRKEHRWFPNQLRHNAATFLRKEFGIEAARVVLGHNSAAITEVYAELDHMRAADIMAQVG